MDDAAALAQLYPDYDFALLPRRGWAAGLVVDYLATLPHVDMKHIAIFGYSRDGKMAALAGALDPRITAVIAGSTGVGGVLPWRAAGERGFGEGIESDHAIASPRGSRRNCGSSPGAKTGCRWMATCWPR